MQEISLYAKFKTVIAHLYQSITSEDDLRIAMTKRRIDFVRSEIVILGGELEQLEKDLVILGVTNELDKMDKPKSIDDEFQDFKE